MAPKPLEIARTSAEEALCMLCDMHLELGYVLSELFPELLSGLGGSPSPEQRPHGRRLTDPDVKTVNEGRNPNNVVQIVE